MNKMNMKNNRPETAIEVNNLNKSFGRKAVLQDLSFRVPNGSITGFLGPNGAGKTTTLRIILGLIPLLDGKITLLNHSLPKERTIAVEQTGAVVENPNFIETLSAFDNLNWFGSLYKPLSKERIFEAIKMVGLKDSAQQKFGTFSTGMKQRLGVAFGILHDPKLLILDEPTSGMDPAGRVQMREILKKIHKEKQTTIFLSSHLLDEVQRLCDYVVIIDQGKNIKEGYVKEILSARLEAWELRIPDNDKEKAAKILKTYPSEQLTHEIISEGFLLKMNQDLSAQINEKLVKDGVKVSALIPRQASLEDTFIKLTSEQTQKEGEE
ncbi:MAG: ABC transporter ATP-binding protein [Candidatus Rifleibacteriota bacterium]